ncbi:MAG TPA: hypothetical protein VI755_11665 [Anaerolineales bacterium]|nr:hypothetical protein [Anaerolineales bacterium]
MPVKIRKLKGGKFRVRIGRRVLAKRTTKTKAMKQARLLRAIDHGFKPRRKRKRAR